VRQLVGVVRAQPEQVGADAVLDVPGVPLLAPVLVPLLALRGRDGDLGDTVAARGWYARVLQADPRNEEIAEIMAKLNAGPAAAAAAPTAETPAKPPTAAAAAPSPTRLTPSAAAPTVQLSAAQVQEMLRARAGSRISAVEAQGEPPTPAVEPPAPPEPPAPELITLDTVSTVEIHAAEPAPMEGLEPTSQSATLDIPAIEPLGLETNAAPGLQAGEAPAPQPLDGLDTIPLDISLPGASPVAATMEIPAIPPAPAAPESAAPVADDGLLDLGSFSIGGESAPPVDAAAAPSPAETPIDGGHDDGLELLDLDLPSTPAPTTEGPPPAPEPTVPTLIMDAVKSVVPAVREVVESTVPVVMDAMESAAPAVIDLVDNAIPSVVEAV
jgi:hypothetical protein